MKRSYTQGTCTNKLLDLSSLPPHEDSIVDNRIHKIETYSQLPKYVDGGSLDFFVEPSSIESISLFESYLYYEIRVVKINKKNEEVAVEAENDLVSYIPFITNTLCKSISMKINDEEIGQSIENYHAYESYLNAVLHLTRTGQRSLLDGSGLHLDKPGTMGFTDPSIDLRTGATFNAGLTERHDLATATNGFVSPLIWAPFLVPRILPTKCELNISLKLNTSEFCLIATKRTKRQVMNEEGNVVEEALPDKPLPTFRIKIEKAQLCLQKYRLSSPAMSRQERMLASSAKYPMIVNKTTSFIIEKNSTQGVRALTIASELPRMAYVFMVSRNALNSVTESPFNFKPFNLSELYLEADGNKYPSSLSYTPKFREGRFIKDWKIFQKELNFENQDLYFNSDGWLATGYSIFPFNMVPDRSVNCNYLSIPENKSGNLNLHVKFNSELTEAICVFVVMEYYKVLLLNSARKPSWM